MLTIVHKYEQYVIDNTTIPISDTYSLVSSYYYILQTNLIDPPMMQPTLGPPWFFFLSFRLYSNNAKSEVSWTLIMLRQPSCVLLIPVSRLIPHLPVHNHFHRCHDQQGAPAQFAACRFLFFYIFFLPLTAGVFFRPITRIHGTTAHPT